jgi:hypothetical protein
MPKPSKYKEIYCDELIAHMAQGLSFESFGAIVHCCKQTLYTWAKTHEEFAESKRIGEEKSRLIWEKIGMNGTVGKIKNFNAASYIFNMKNRFGWRDSQPNEDDGEVKAFVLSYQTKKKTEE